MIEFLLKIIILVWPFGQFMRFTYQNTNIYALDILCGLLLISLFVNPKVRRQVLSDFLLRPLMIFLSVATLSLLLRSFFLPTSDFFRAAFYLCRLFVYPAIYFAVKTTDFKKLKSSLISSIVIFVSLGLFQYLFFPDATSLKFIGFDDHYYRLIDTFFDPNYTGLVLVILLLYLLEKSKFLYAITVVPLIALTFSRASYLVLFIGSIAISFKKKWRIAAIIPLILILASIISPKPYGEGVNLLRSFSIFSRISSWQEGINLFSSSPVLGVGYNTLTSSVGQRIGIDNSFIYILATTGLIGFTAFIYMLFKVAQMTYKTDFFIPIIAIFLHSLFNNSLFYIWIFSVFWLMIGLSVRGYKRS